MLVFRHAVLQLSLRSELFSVGAIVQLVTCHCCCRCCTSFQTSRLFLSHLGILSLENLHVATYQPQPSLVSLGTVSLSLSAALHELDSMPTRNTENVYVLYVRTGQYKLMDMFRNKVSLYQLTVLLCSC